MAKNKALNTFHVQGSMKVMVGIEIKAESFQDALTKAKELQITDFITIDGDYNDGEFLGIDFISSNEPQKL